MFRNRSFYIFGVIALAVILSSCSAEQTVSNNNKASTQAESGESTPIPVVSGKVILDWDSASIRLPLDEYGMSDSEVRIVTAAQQIVVAQCVLTSDVVPEETLNSARDILRPPSIGGMWTFGFWDAPFIAKNGLQAVSPPSVPINAGLKTDDDHLRACLNEQDYLDLDPISVSYYTNDPNIALLVRFSVESFQKTLLDDRFVALLQNRQQCLAADGYSVDPNSSIGNVSFLPEWNEEQQAQAAVAMATCSDDQQSTQIAGDIEAAYQQEYIDTHQAELTTIRNIVDQHLSKAKVVLSGVGLM